jgi:hypothetical protein
MPVNNKLTVRFALVIIFIAMLTILNACSRNEELLIGVKIYSYSGDFDQLAEQWMDLAVNTAFVSEALASNPEFRESAKNSGIDVYVISPVFQNPAVLDEDSTLYAITNKGFKGIDHWVKFVCPSREEYRQKKKSEIAGLVRTLKPDGVSIDFIRHFIYWEMIYPDREPGTIEKACYCDHCITSFLESVSKEMPGGIESTADKAMYLETNYSEEWNNWRTSLITNMVRDISESVRQADPSVKVVAHVMPWRESDFDGAIINVGGQDIGAIARYVDYIQPMAYSQMLRREPAWINDVVADMNRKAPGKILPSIQVDTEYISDEYTPGDFGQCIIESLRSPSKGVVYYYWNPLRNDPERFRVAREALQQVN